MKNAVAPIAGRNSRDVVQATESTTDGSLAWHPSPAGTGTAGTSRPADGPTADASLMYISVH
jgi:hypothetical protein